MITRYALNTKDDEEQQRMRRLNNTDIWLAVGVTFAEYQDQRPVGGDYCCRECKTHFDPTINGPKCPRCGA